MSITERIKIISASAGSGKTTRLAAELEDAVVARGIPPTAIVATTFTRKAAAELMERGRTALISAGRLADAERFGAARIGTVNSVCGRIVSDFAFELGVSPNLDVLDEKRADEAFKRCLSEVVSQDEQETLTGLVARFYELPWSKMVQRVVEQARMNGLSPDALGDCAKRSIGGLVPLLGPVLPDGDHDRRLEDALSLFVDRMTAREAAEEDITKVSRRATAEARRQLIKLRTRGFIRWNEWARLAGLSVAKKSQTIVDPVVEVASQFDSHPQLHQDLTSCISLTYSLAERSLRAYQDYKRARRAIDFVDQEAMALELLQRDDIKDRLRDEISLVLVDEFQDTSPIQLAIFLELAKVADENIWVGDQKQAIYGFRGTDPALMDAAVDAIVGDEEPETLKKSWRSRPNLVRATSALFAKAFSSQGIPNERVALEPGRPEEPEGLGPEVERWVLDAKNADQDAIAVANAIRDFLDDVDAQVRDRATGVPRKARPSDVAVLCRRRKMAAQVANALVSAGIGAVLPRAGLLSTAEGRVVLTALRLWADSHDSLAAAELARIVAYPEDPDAWLAQALSQPGSSAFADADVVKSVHQAREAAPFASGIEAYDRIVEASGIRELCLAWGRSEERLANIDALRGHVLAFASTSLVDGQSSSVAALVGHLQALEADDEDAQAVVAAEGAVTVTTWHAAKGLEWPITVLFQLEKDPLVASFGVSSETEGGSELNFEQPLDGRWVRYWPNPFHPAQSKTQFHTRLKASPTTVAAEAREARQELRLLYVGWTRARDRVVFAGRSDISAGILSQLRDESGLLFVDPSGAATGDGEASVSWAGASVDVRVRAADSEPPITPDVESGSGFDAAGTKAHPRAFLAPSEVSAPGDIGEVVTLGDALGLGSGFDIQRFGSALHGFFAVDGSDLSQAEREDLAAELFARWVVGADFDVRKALDASDRLRAFVEERWPGAKWHREWPLAHRLDSGTLVRGTADLVLETDAGFVLIDHKSYPGSQAAAVEKAKGFAGQLRAYREAIEAATDKAVLTAFIHLPMVGSLVEVRDGERPRATKPKPAAVAPAVQPLTSAQIPQADSPEVLLAVLRAEAAGEEYADVSERQVAYYKKAARLFGLMSSIGALTVAGRRAAEAQGEDATLRCLLGFRESASAKGWATFAGVEDVGAAPPETAGEYLEQAVGLAPSTATRRARTLQRWQGLLGEAPSDRLQALTEPSAKPQPLDTKAVFQAGHATSGRTTVQQPSEELGIHAIPAQRSEFVTGAIGGGGQRQQALADAQSPPVPETAEEREPRMLKLEDIKAKMNLVGVEPSGPVSVIAVDELMGESVTITYKDANGGLHQKMLFRTDEPQLSEVTKGLAWSFDAPADDFKLGAEALRIKLAHLFDPMMAVHTSDVEPLPHQISAVYESMLPRQPLRYVLADDPGAGKTIMAGLLIRELMIRGDLERCLVVSPGGLVDQWQSELLEKFGVRFDILTHQLVDSTATGNPFTEKNLLIARLDQLARNDDWKDKLQAEGAMWDLVIFDEAHKLSATYFGNEKKTTKRYNLAYDVLTKADHARNVLLMTATPHNGKEEDFQLWMALVDPDRFYGKARKKNGKVDSTDLMRRMVKEDLLKFDGSKLFPERRAQTIRYNLSPAEKQLYERVTEYVRTEMGRAENLDGKRKGTVGFALTILQRRLASSPKAITESLRRRRERLETRLQEMKAIVSGEGNHTKSYLPPNIAPEDIDDYLDELSAEEIEALEENVIDEATAAKTIPELEAEIIALKDLEHEAKVVLHSRDDRKWDELSKILQDDSELLTEEGRRRKLIIFTEHKDTLTYLEERIRAVLGNPRSVATIHGGTRREDRLKIQEAFRQDPEVVVLVATDAAGEGVNLQNANLMVNYDLPWNPNRIEQRFGRIHRIGQTEVCHLWNLVAIDTREGDVFNRLFEKLEVAKESLEGKVFDVLGQGLFEDKPLRDLLIEAIRYGEQPEVRAKLFEKVDAALDVAHLQDLIKRNALTPDVMSQEHLFSIKEQMEKAEARKLQPFFLRKFLFESFQALSGELREREAGRYEIRHVPAMVRKKNAIEGTRMPVLAKYERVTFERDLIRVLHKPMADLMHPGHPLMGAVIELTLERVQQQLKRGAILVDPVDESTTPRMLFIIDHGIREGTSGSKLASRRTVMVEIDADGNVQHPGPAPYLDYQALAKSERALIDDVLAQSWLQNDLEQMAINYAAAQLVPAHLAEVKDRRETHVKKTQEAVWERLTREINYWSQREQDLLMKVQAGKQPKMQPINARRTAEELKARRDVRMKQLNDQLHLSSNPPAVLGGALVIPQGLIDQLNGKEPPLSADAAARKHIEDLAMKAVFDAEHALGHVTKDVSKENCGWDITSIPPKGETRHIEVKGRRADADSIIVTHNEVLTALNQGKKFFLAIVRIGEHDEVDGPHYVRAPFSREPEPGMVAVEMRISALLSSSQDGVDDA